jgi:tetratricopeptide (TPR) repeat protein
VKSQNLLQKFIILFLLGNSGCALRPAPALNQPPVLADPRIEKAQIFFDQGDLANALIQWKILNAKYPGNPAYRKQIIRTKKLIDKRSAEHLTTAKAAFNTGNYQQAKFEFLKVLALNPQNNVPLPYLRDIEHVQLATIQLVKLERMQQRKQEEAASKTKLEASAATEAYDETQVTSDQEEERYYLALGIDLFQHGDYEGSASEFEKYLNSYPEDQKAKNYLSQAYQELGNNFDRKGTLINALELYEKSNALNPGQNAEVTQKIDAIKKQLAEEYYQKGLRIYRTDIDQAIVYLRDALSYDPQHANARFHLNQAMRMLKRLKELKK